MRAFLGVPLPADDGLRELLEELRGCGADLKVVREDQLHLTVKFLDEIPEAAGAQLATFLRTAGLPGAFEVELRDVGAFPNWKKMNVLWAGIEDPCGDLTKIFLAAERAWVGLGHPGEGRPFVAHLTLARKRTDHNVQAARDALGRHRGRRFGRTRVDRVNLYRSTLTSQGSVYEVVEAIRL